MIPTKILIPVDGSENSKRASEFALELSKKIGSSVVFLNVVEIPISSYKYQRVAANLLQFLEDSGRKLLTNFEAKAQSDGVSCEVVLSHGDPTNQILATARRKNCDCIVMGKRGLGRLQRVLLGSVSDQITKLSDVPVITVK